RAFGFGGGGGGYINALLHVPPGLIIGYQVGSSGEDTILTLPLNPVIFLRAQGGSPERNGHARVTSEDSPLFLSLNLRSGEGDFRRGDGGSSYNGGNGEQGAGNGVLTQGKDGVFPGGGGGGGKGGRFPT